MSVDERWSSSRRTLRPITRAIAADVGLGYLTSASRADALRRRSSAHQSSPSSPRSAPTRKATPLRVPAAAASTTDALRPRRTHRRPAHGRLEKLFAYCTAWECGQHGRGDRAQSGCDADADWIVDLGGPDGRCFDGGPARKSARHGPPPSAESLPGRSNREVHAGRRARSAV